MTASRRARRERRRSQDDLQKAVRQARALGVTWERIGDVLNLRPLEVARRYGRRDYRKLRVSHYPDM